MLQACGGADLAQEPLTTERRTQVGVPHLDGDVAVVLSTAELDRLVGSWSPPGAPFRLGVEREGNALTFVPPNATRHSLLALSRTLFVAPSLQPGFALRVVLDGDRVAALEFQFPGQPRSGSCGRRRA